MTPMDPRTAPTRAAEAAQADEPGATRTASAGSPDSPVSPSPLATAPGPANARADAFVRRLFRIMAIIEAFTWAGLIVGMLDKYVFTGNETGVAIFGLAHGVAWILFIGALFAAALRFRWTFWTLVLGGVSSVLPLMTVPFDIWAERSGKLSSRGPGLFRRTRTA